MKALLVVALLLGLPLAAPQTLSWAHLYTAPDRIYSAATLEGETYLAVGASIYRWNDGSPRVVLRFTGLRIPHLFAFEDRLWFTVVDFMWGGHLYSWRPGGAAPVFVPVTDWWLQVCPNCPASYTPGVIESAVIVGDVAYIGGSCGSAYMPNMVWTAAFNGSAWTSMAIRATPKHGHVALHYGPEGLWMATTENALARSTGLWETRASVYRWTSGRWVPRVEDADPGAQYNAVYGFAYHYSLYATTAGGLIWKLTPTPSSTRYDAAFRAPASTRDGVLAPDNRHGSVLNVTRGWSEELRGASPGALTTTGAYFWSSGLLHLAIGNSIYARGYPARW